MPENVDKMICIVGFIYVLIEAMEWLNYHHLRYFWMVAQEGTVSAAAKVLRLSRPTVTAQVRMLEESLGRPLFQRSGRRLRLTAFGQEVLSHAEEIFSAGSRIQDLARGVEGGNFERLVVGLPDVMPKLIAYRLIEPALKLAPPTRLECREGSFEDLIGELALRRLDIVLAETPVAAGSSISAHSHRLGECGVSIFGKASLARRFRRGFPASLHEAPMLLPARRTAIRQGLGRWMEKHGLHPNVVGEFDDSALLKVFGQTGLGLFPAPSAIENEIKKQYSVELVGRVPELREQFYAITLEKRLRDPAIVAITEAARESLFGQAEGGS